MPVSETDGSLRERCFQAVGRHFAALGTEAVLALPSRLISDLLPYLTVCQLDQVQPVLNRRGISTFPGWFKILQDLSGFTTALKFNTEEKAKQEVMRFLFILVFYGFRNRYITRHGTHLKSRSFLLAAASCIEEVLVLDITNRCLNSLTCDQRALITLLEKNVRRVGCSLADLAGTEAPAVLYTLHRLFDHGAATKLCMNMDSPTVLAWLLHGRGTQYVNPKMKKPNQICCTSETSSANEQVASLHPHTEASDAEEDHRTPSKRPRLDNMVLEDSGDLVFTVDPRVLCQTFGCSAAPSAEVCSRGQIECLEIRSCTTDSLKVLSPALPTFFCLRSLTLLNSSILKENDVLDVAAALKKLSDSSCSSLTELSIGVLPSIELMINIVESFPRLTSLSVEIQKAFWLPPDIFHPPLSAESELPLEKLTVKISDDQTDVRFITSLLSRSPHLTVLHVVGMRPTGSTQRQLLSVISESNHHLRFLDFEDMKLCGCLPEILNLLRACKLEELRLGDCRLLENCVKQEESVQQLVAALKMVPSLCKLSLAQNRLSKSVCVLAHLFSGSSQSPIKHLDISSNFILPADMLEFAKTLRSLSPLQGLTLDLRKNPADRDLDTWNKALQRLRPFRLILDNGWKSTDTMLDHVSNM
uniref:Leucine-rich repeat-containing protein 41 n=1 Tax=Nothobranchius kuhntae TaxID=321403 RepID=A0A1A8I0S1_NOTKU